MTETWPTCPSCGFEVFKWSNARCPFCSGVLPPSMIEQSRALGGEPDQPDHAPVFRAQALSDGVGAAAGGVDGAGIARMFGLVLGLLVVATVLVGIVGGIRGADVTPAGPTSHASCDPSYLDDCLDDHAQDYDCVNRSGDGPEYVERHVTVDWKVEHPDRFDLDPDRDGIGCN